MYLHSSLRKVYPEGTNQVNNQDLPTYISIAQKYIGLDEHDDAEEIMEEILKPAGIDLDPSETPWCAAFVTAILEMSGLPALDTLRARDYADYGEECDDEIGAIVVYKSHVGFVPEPGKCLGGNQSDGINIGEQRWYGKPIAYRKPPSKTNIAPNHILSNLTTEQLLDEIKRRMA